MSHCAQHAAPTVAPQSLSPSLPLWERLQVSRAWGAWEAGAGVSCCVLEAVGGVAATEARAAAAGTIPRFPRAEPLPPVPPRTQAGSRGSEQGQLR